MPKDSGPVMTSIDANRPMQDANKAIGDLKYKVRTVDKTASYTCLVSDSGTHFTQSGGAIVFTLPAVADSTGVEYWFASLSTANYDLTVTAPANTMVYNNVLTGTSLGFGTSAEIIGGVIHVVCNGTVWIATAEVGNVAQDYTVA